jgi:hypothetical protein
MALLHVSGRYPLKVQMTVRPRTRPPRTAAGMITAGPAVRRPPRAAPQPRSPPGAAPGSRSRIWSAPPRIQARRAGPEAGSSRGAGRARRANSTSRANLPAGASPSAAAGSGTRPSAHAQAAQARTRTPGVSSISASGGTSLGSSSALVLPLHPDSRLSWARVSRGERPGCPTDQGKHRLPLPAYRPDLGGGG